MLAHVPFHVADQHAQEHVPTGMILSVDWRDVDVTLGDEKAALFGGGGLAGFDSGAECDVRVSDGYCQTHHRKFSAKDCCKARRARALPVFRTTLPGCMGHACHRHVSMGGVTRRRVRARPRMSEQPDANGDR